MTVGFHAPLPPSRTGVADYAAALLHELSRFTSVCVNSSGAADVELYHLGNNKLHERIYRLALERPGVVVLHDAVLHHFLLGTLDEDCYVEEFAYNYGDWSRGLARELWNSRARSSQDPRYFAYPMLRRIVERSRTVVVHNPAAAEMVRTHAPQTRVVEIPHFFQTPAGAPSGEAAALRARLGLGGRAVLFGVFGHLRESKRLFSILRAFGKVRSIAPNAVLLVAGGFVSSDLARAVEPLLALPGVLRRGYLAEPDFWRHAWAVDTCINLRYPAAGETSGISIRMMGIGKATIVTAGAENAPFPELACLKVDAGPAETDMTAAYLLWLAQVPEAGREIGQRAARHIGEQHSLEGCAARYWDALKKA